MYIFPCVSWGHILHLSLLYTIDTFKILEPQNRQIDVSELRKPRRLTHLGAQLL